MFKVYFMFLIAINLTFSTNRVQFITFAPNFKLKIN